VNRYFENDRLETLLSRSRLVIFDMNGLIVDDEKLQLESVNAALGSGILERGASSNDAIRIDEEYWKRYCLGKRTDQFFALILRERGLPARRDTIEKLLRKKNAFYGERARAMLRELVRPGVIELMEHIAENGGQKTALATSALPEEVESILGKSGLDLKGRFGFIAHGADIVKTKPDPEIYFLLSSRSGIPPAECLVLEDSGVGVKAAANAGMPCIAFPNAFTLSHDFSTAACAVDSLRRDAGILGTRLHEKNVPFGFTTE
jgi:HAD superfamily hydrolase (TIGR01509 family)